MSWHPVFSHPALWLFAGGLAVLLLRRRLPAPPVGIAFAAVALLTHLRPPAGVHRATVAGFDLLWLRADSLSLLFALVFSLVALLGLLYGAHRMGSRETAAALFYAGSAIATVFAGDWITFFVFWEGMALTSLVLIWEGGAGAARAAGMRYLLVHAAGGSLLFLGIVRHLASGGSAAVTALDGGGPPFWLLLAAVALNAAVPPLHAWLTDSYPEASTSGSVFLSAFTTKTAVYALLRIFPGTEALVPIGVAMTLYGVVFALLENDLRRLLGYHIVSQVGYMVTAVGIGTPLALNGAGAHAFSHILYKALLFMGAGAAIEATGRRKLSELGAVAGRMPFAVAMYLVGALSISGAPAFNGFISKSMIVSAAGEAHHFTAELLLTLAAVGTFLSVGLKLPVFAFFRARQEVPGKGLPAKRPPGERLPVKRLPPNLLAAMGIAGGLCFLYGIYPDLLYRRLPEAAGYQPFTLDHTVSAVQLLLAAGIAFWLLFPLLQPSPGTSLDTDWIYRRPLRRAGAAVLATLAEAPAFAALLRQQLVAAASRAARRAATGSGPPDHADPSEPREAPEPYGTEAFSFRRPIGRTILFAALAAALLLAWRLAAG